MGREASGYVKKLRVAPTGEPITRTEKLVLMVLADYFNANKGEAWPSIRAIAGDTHLSERHARRLISVLREKGIIEVVSRSRADGSNTSNGYRFIGLTSAARGNRGAATAGDTDTVTSGGGDVAMAGQELINERSREHTKREGDSFLSLEEKEFISSLNKEALVEGVKVVWDYYLQSLGKPKGMTLTPRKCRVGLDRLKEIVVRVKKDGNEIASAVDILQGAVDELVKSKWHMGKDERTKGTLFVDWEKHLFGSTETFERWLLLMQRG